jgi:hypothetical protein
MEGLDEALAELRALEYDDNDGSEDSSYDEAVVARAIAFVEALLLVDETTDFGGACQLVRHSLTVSYKHNVLNESTLKAWKLFSRLIPHIGALELSQREQMLGDVCTLLETYCTEGLDVLNLPESTKGDMNLFVDQQKVTVKLLGFFSQRVCEVISLLDQLLDPAQLQSCWTVLLRFHGALSILSMHSPAFSAMLTDSAQRTSAVVLPTQGPARWGSLLPSVLQGSNVPHYEISVGLCTLSISILESFLESGSSHAHADADVSVVQHCALCNICALESLAVQHTGKIGDSVAVGMLTEMAGTVAGFMASVDSAESAYAVMVRPLLCGPRLILCVILTMFYTRSL